MDRHDDRDTATHPRPLLRRASWWSLDGEWDFALDPEQKCESPGEVAFDRRIRVPFAPETPASGIGHTDYLARCWYRRTVVCPALEPGHHLILQCGAVDFAATVWIDGSRVIFHEGGYSPFSVDVTQLLGDGRPHELVVRADDDPHDLGKPRGKQDWEREPHSIWYPRTTGIWQSVWLEALPAVHIDALQWSTERAGSEVSLELELAGGIERGYRVHVQLHAGDRLLADDHLGVLGARMHRSFSLDGSGLDELRDALVWTPDHPVIIDASIDLEDRDGNVVDHIDSYTAIRTVGFGDGRFLLNGRPLPLRLVLDQGYWPDSGLTPPDEDALRRDVELIKAMGFNGVRKHQKIEDPRFLYWADRLGLMVWYECPPVYRFDALAVRRVTAEWTAAIERDRSHPCIIAWVPFNESTGVLALPERADQRSFVLGLTHLTKALDPTRPVVSNDGWETVGGDVIGVHDYEQDPDALVEAWNRHLSERLLGYGNHGRLQTLDEDRATWVDGRPSRPIVLTEFGGIGWEPEAPLNRSDDGVVPDAPGDRINQPSSWGYSTVRSADELAARYRALLDAVHAIPVLAGFCYTQLADTYQEVNGLLYADRTPKIPLEVIAEATMGMAPSFFDPLERS